MVHPKEAVGGDLQVLDDKERMIDGAVVATHQFSNGSERHLHFAPHNVHQALPGFHPFPLAVSALHHAATPQCAWLPSQRSSKVQRFCALCSCYLYVHQVTKFSYAANDDVPVAM